MKKITILILSVIAIAAAYPLFAAQDFGFSDPIPIVGDNPNDLGGTSAVRMYFFDHPSATVNDKNFSSNLQIAGKRVGDVVAAPGSKITLWRSDMLTSLPVRVGSTLTSRSGMGPRGFRISSDDNFSLTRNFNLSVNRSYRNQSGRRLILADVRNATQGEYSGFNIETDNPYIGDASDKISPYPGSGGLTHPAMIRDHALNFKVCSRFNNNGAYFDCTKEDTIMPIEDVISYDMITDFMGELIVAPSFDSLQLEVPPNKAERGYDVKLSDQSRDAYAQNSMEMNVSFTSPNVFYNLDDNKELYKLLGYSNLLSEDYHSIPSDAEDVKEDMMVWSKDQFITTTSTLFAMGSLIPYTNTNKDLLVSVSDSIKDTYFTNPSFPIASNPVASKKLDGEKFAVLYYNTLFSWDDYILNPYGRPAIFRDWKAHRLEELIGLKMSNGSFTPLKDWTGFSHFYSNKVVVPVIFWNMKGPVDTSSYEKSNPSSLLGVSFAALIDYGASSHPGIFNMEVLNDRSTSSDHIAKRYMLIPSSKKDEDNGKLRSVLYVVDPDDASKDLYMKSWGYETEPDAETPIYEMTPAEVITKLPFKTPSHQIVFDSAQEGAVPYQIATGNLDGNKCEDVVVSYRNGTFEDRGYLNAYNDFNVIFPNAFTIIFRAEAADGSCSFDPKHITVKHRQLPVLASNTPQGLRVSAVAIGNFVGPLDKTGRAKKDIAVGNLLLEFDDSGTRTGYMYIFANSANDLDTDGIPDFTPSNTGYDPSTGNGVLRVQAGFQKRNPASMTRYWGVGYLTTDQINSGSEYDNLGAISGLPLMLPSLSCPASVDDETRAFSQHEGMLSVLYSRMSKTIGKDMVGLPHKGMETPFQMFERPAPQRCAPKTGGVCTLDFEGITYDLPLWNQTDECSPCSILDNLCDLQKLNQQTGTPLPEIFSGIGASWCMIPNGPINTKAQECESSIPNKPSSSVGFQREDLFAYLTNTGGIADGAHTQNAYSYVGRGDNWESINTYYQAATVYYAPATIMDNLLAAVDAWQSYLPVSTPASVPIDPATAGCTLVPPPSTYPDSSIVNRAIELMPKISTYLPPVVEDVVERSGSGLTTPTGVEPGPDKYPDLGYTIPLIKGREMPGPREMTVILGGLPCGNGILEPNFGEECDKSITTPQCTAENQSGSCHDDCFCSICGDGNKDPAEECDPGSENFSDTYPDGCRTGCKLHSCGDGVVDTGEECENGQTKDGFHCNPLACEWVPNTCGDGVHSPEEQCDLSAGTDQCATASGLTCESCVCEPVCGDDIVAGDEVCDGTAGCQSGYACNDECSVCEKVPLCGDGTVDLGETCGEPGLSCNEGFECIAQGQPNACTCTHAPEIIEESCGNGVLDAGEQCDGSNNPCPDGSVCNECICEKVSPLCGNGVLDAGEACDGSGNPCPEGLVCDSCVCKKDTDPGTGGPHSFSSDCEVKCVSFANEAEKLYYDSLNETYFRAPSGRKDDFFCPNNSVIQMSCLVADAAFNGSVGPWMMVQSKGMVLHDMAKITSSDFPFDVVAPQSPIRIAPLASSASSGGKAAAVVLPNLASIRGNLEFSTSGVSPMAATSVMESTAGIMTINNMIEHRAVALMPSSSKSQSKETGNAAAAPAVHYTRLRAYPEPTHTTIESWPKDLDPEKLYVENRLKPDYVRSIIETRKKDGMKATRDIALGISDDVGIYEMSILQETYGEKSSGTTAVNYSFYAGPVSSISEGGAGCGKCSISENSGFNAKAAAPILLAVLLSALALGAVRVRASVRSKRK